MNATRNSNPLRPVLAVIAAALVLGGCATSPPPCGGPTSKNLSSAIDQVKTSLSAGCAASFDRFYDDLLTVAEGDPRAENKREFSEEQIRQGRDAHLSLQYSGSNQGASQAGISMGKQRMIND